MGVQTQLISLHNGDKAMILTDIDVQTRKKVLKLLDRQNCQNETESSTVNNKWVLYIDPMSSGLLAWNLFFIFVFYILQLQISLSLAFGPSFFKDEGSLGGFYFPVYLSLLLVLLINIAISFFKGYTALGGGKVVDDGRVIAGHYLANMFPVDIITAILYIVPILDEGVGLDWLQFLTGALLWIRKGKCQNQMQLKLQYQAGLRSTLILIILFSDALIFGSYGAVIFIMIDIALYKVAYYGTGNTYYWLTNNTSYSNPLMEGPWYFQYIYAQFFSTGTLSTMAPGPFGKNPIEVTYSVFLMIFLFIYASYLADVIVQVVYTYTQSRLKHQGDILAFDNFMRVKDVEESIRLRIYNYFELKWELEGKTQSVQQEQMLAKLPLYLREELLQEIGFARHLYFLHALPHEGSLRRLLSLRIVRTTADANTCIFEPQTFGTSPRTLYYIKEGVAKFYLESQGRGEVKGKGMRQTVLNLSSVERVIGVYQFITGQDFSLCCRSLDLCLIQSLSWSAFLQVLSQLKIREHFEEFRHRVLIQRQLHLINKICIACTKQHIEAECPILFYNREVANNMFQALTSPINIRQQKTRRQLVSHKAVKKNGPDTRDLFSMFSNMELDNILVHLITLEKTTETVLEEVAYFQHFYPAYNMANSRSSNQSFL